MLVVRHPDLPDLDCQRSSAVIETQETSILQGSLRTGRILPRHRTGRYFCDTHFNGLTEVTPACPSLQLEKKPFGENKGASRAPRIEYDHISSDMSVGGAAAHTESILPGRMRPHV